MCGPLQRDDVNARRESVITPHTLFPNCRAVHAMPTTKDITMSVEMMYPRRSPPSQQQAISRRLQHRLSANQRRDHARKPRRNTRFSQHLVSMRLASLGVTRISSSCPAFASQPQTILRNESVNHETLARQLERSDAMQCAAR